MIRQEVINKLDSVYPHIPIYGEKAEQDFDEPSFYVKVLNGHHQRGLNTRFALTHKMDIHYFGGTKKACEAMAMELYNHMEYLLDYLARGMNMHHEVVDNVLHFFVDYKLHLTKEIIPEDNMETLTVNNNVKG